MQPARLGAIAALAAALLGLPAAIPAIAKEGAAAPPFARLIIDPDHSELDYEVLAKLFLVADEDIVGRNREVSGEVELDGLNVHGQVRLPAAGFKSGVGTRDRHVAQILQADLFPEITFDITGTEGFDVKEPAGRCTVKGSLTIRDHRLPLAIPVHYEHSKDRLQLDGTVRVHFSDFGIAPPVLGFVVKRAPDELFLKAHLIAQVQPDPAAAPVVR